jgi:pilus assembly protein CpaE
VHSTIVEISRKDFENTIERKIDLLFPADPKAMALAAKLGQPIVEAARSSKLSLGLIALADMISGSFTETAVAELAATKSKSKSTIFAGFKTMLKKK